MSSVRTIAGRELRTAFRDRMFVTITGLFLGMSILSVYVGSATRRAELQIYQGVVDTLRQGGATLIPPRPEIYTLTILSNLSEYIAIVGAILAIALGYKALTQEREAGTLKLVLSRPVYRDSFYAGKILGNATVLAILLGMVLVFNVLLVALVGGTWPTGTELLRLTGLVLTGFIYMLMFFTLAMFLSSVLPDSSTVLLVALAVWMVVTFVIPQMAETLMANSTTVNSVTGFSIRFRRTRRLHESLSTCRQRGI